MSVDTTNLRSQIENALKGEFKIKVSSSISNKNAASTAFNKTSAVGLTTAQLRQVETARRKSQIRTSEFEKKSNLKVHEAKLKNHHTIKSDDFLIKLLSC